MSTTLDQFRGKSWSEVVVRHKIKPNEILLSEDNSYDLVRCRQCRRVVKSGFVDIHSKKCKQFQSNLPKNPTLNNGKITMAKYYYHIPPIDNSTNPELNPHKRITEPPHKKRKVNKNNRDKNTDSPSLILPQCLTNSNHKSNSIYNDLYRGLKPYTTLNKSKPKTQNKKLKLRFSRSRINQNNNKNNSISKNNNNTNTNDSDVMINNQKPVQNPLQAQNHKSQVQNNNNNNSTSNRHRFIMSAWEREEEIINERIKQECSLSYVPCAVVYNAYAKTLDKYSQEYTTRGHTNNLKHYDKELNKMNSNAFWRPIIKNILNRNNYKENGEQFEEFMALEDIIGLSYNLPKQFSNNIIPPHEIKYASNKQTISLKSFIEDGKLQHNMQRDENDFYMKELPYSPFKYINSQLHNKVIKIKMDLLKHKHILYLRQKEQVKRQIQQRQLQQQQQTRRPHVIPQPTGPPSVSVPVPVPGVAMKQRYLPGPPPGAAVHAPINRPIPLNVGHTPTPVPVVASTPSSAIPISRGHYNRMMNGHARGYAHGHRTVPRQMYNDVVPNMSRGGSYSSGNSVNTQISSASRNTHGSYRHINTNNNVNVPPAVNVPPNIAMHNGRGSVGSVPVPVPVVPVPPQVQSQYPSHLPTQQQGQSAVPSPFVNSGRNSVGPQPPNILRRDSVNSAGNINYRYRQHNGSGNRGRSGSITPRNMNMNPHMNMNNIIRPPRYDNMNVNNENNNSNYNASPSDTQITNISALTQQPVNNNTNTNVPISLSMNNGNNNNNPSPQSINSNHTNYTGVSQHSTTQMTYNTRGNNGSVNGSVINTQSHRIYTGGPGDMIRNTTTDSEMYMPSIGC